MADRVGQQLGSYRLIRLIGKGGFSEVYLGEHVYLKTQAAIKVLQMQVANEDMGFLNEARTIARLEHPNIVRVLDYGVQDDTPFLVMTYAPNGSMRQRHPKGKPMPLESVVSYVKQVAAALQYAHDKKLIHRDIKPENMLLGSNNEVLLSDFGIAAATQSSRFQATQEIVGTMPYMAPEQLQGKPGRASDQYALGIVVYEWLCGDRPFNGSSFEVYSQQLFTSPPSLREKVPTISPDVEQVVLTALAKDPQQRFISVQAFANALEQAYQPEQPTLVIQSFYSTTPISFAPTTPSIHSAVTEEQTPVAPSDSNNLISQLPTVLIPTVSESIVPIQEAPGGAASATTPSRDKCPYCGAEVRPGDNFCLNCDNRLLPASPSPQQAQPVLGDVTLPAEDEWGGSLIGNLSVLTSPSVVFSGPEAPTAYGILPGEQIEAESAVPQAGQIIIEPIGPIGEQTVAASESVPASPSGYETILSSPLSPQPPPTSVPHQTREQQLKRQRLEEGDAHYKAKHYEESLAVYEQLIVLDPQDGLLHHSRGNALRKLKRHREALGAYERALAIISDNASIWIVKGEVLKSLRRYKEALAAYEQALVLAPDNALILTAKSEVLYKLERYAEALDACESALVLAPTTVFISHIARTWTIKANVLYRLERYDEALGAYDSVLKMIPSNPLKRASIFASKGEALYKLERYDEALKAYDDACVLKPLDATLANKRDMLRNLKRHKDEKEELKASHLANRQNIGVVRPNEQPLPPAPDATQISNRIPDLEGTVIAPKNSLEGTIIFEHYDVFLSHLDLDAEWVEKHLAMRLEDQEHLRVWLDKWILVPGQPFQPARARGLDQARSCAVCIGEHTPIGWFEQEIQRAQNKQAKDPSFRVIPVLLPNAKDINLDNFLELKTVVDFRGLDHAQAFHLLVCGVKGIAPGRWPPEESTITKTVPSAEDRLWELKRYRQSELINETVAVEFQRIVLEKFWLSSSGESE